jgi:hypothetical protein
VVARKRDARGRFVKAKRAGKKNPAPASLPLKVAIMGGPPIAQFRSLPRARQYARALADHTGKRVRVFNPARRGFSMRRGKGRTRGLALNPKSRFGGSGGKFRVCAMVRGRPAFKGWYDDRLETRREDGMQFSTKVVAMSEARRMARRWPEYTWWVEKPDGKFVRIQKP